MSVVNSHRGKGMFAAMKLAQLMLVFVALTSGCGKKKSEPSTAGSAVGSAPGSAGSAGSAAGSADSEVTPQASGSAADTGTGSAGEPAGKAEIDPRFAKLSPQDQRTCKGYAGCLIDNEKSDLDDATPEQEAAIDAKENAYINKCAAVWLELSADAQEKLAACVDEVGDCSISSCFEPHAL